jgi:hypothetical protein
MKPKITQLVTYYALLTNYKSSEYEVIFDKILALLQHYDKGRKEDANKLKKAIKRISHEAESRKLMAYEGVILHALDQFVVDELEAVQNAPQRLALATLQETILAEPAYKPNIRFAEEAEATTEFMYEMINQLN